MPLRGEEPTFDVSVAAATDATASPRVRSGLAFVGADLAGGALGAVDADDRGGLPTGLRRGADRLPPRRPWLRRPTPGPGPARGPGTSRAGQRELLVKWGSTRLGGASRVVDVLLGGGVRPKGHGRGVVSEREVRSSVRS